jgi:uncharacterized membrane protein
MAERAIPASGRAATRTDGLTLAALGLTVTLWASAFPGIRAALAWYTPEHLAVVRNLVAVGAFAVYAAATRLGPPVVHDLPGLLLIGLLGTLQQLALNYGARTVSAGAVSFLVGTVPIFTALLAIAFLGERLHVWGWMVARPCHLGACCIVSHPSHVLPVTADVHRSVFPYISPPLMSCTRREARLQDAHHRRCLSEGARPQFRHRVSCRRVHGLR